LGLDFGAVDIGHRIIDNKVFVFEVNTAPGIEGTTLQRYVNTFNEYIYGV
jgi:glutathione synthase/RimK-type ligase-like ATP-grasp enzyme